ncbi:T6SS immunity protein Tli4 family protein [Collimonas sp.]|uniref:T6SS immunity protein Tli4 family protein n=1 Tax=Collimonas sp. TaxID=1963772 RepID=UPI002D181A5B|nr:T6SS immunity protein Tli4 family protein [Collimonas sp.]HWW05252.1 T6SS immunity protein Tli4 family protein [Collimonas sp.]
MSETKTYCVGRFLVDAPKEAEINGQGYEFMFGRIESERSGVDAKGFTALMEKREADIKSGALEGKYQLTKTLTPLPNSRLFVASRTLFRSTAYAIDTHRLDGGILFSMKQDSFGPEKIDSVVDRLQKNLLAHLRARQSNEIPTEPGFCIKDGFIADDGSKDQAEYGQIGFRFKAWPDVLIVFTTRENGEKLDDTLLERYAKSPIHTEYADVIGRIKTFRKGDRKVGSLAGEEIVQAYPTDAGYFIHQFAWDSPGQPNAAFSPNVHVEMFTGQGHAGERTVRPSLTDDQAIKLFDSVVNSIRLRPTGPVKVSSAEPTSPQAPLGEIVATGSICPQTGWWQCVETGNVDGGRRRFFKAGEAMPAALLLGDANIWQSLRGQRPSHSLNTVWSLVAYEETAAAPVIATAKTDAPDVPGASLPDQPPPG